MVIFFCSSFFCLKIQWITPSRRTSKLLTLARGRCSQHTLSGLVWPSTSQSSTMKSSTTRTGPAAWLRRYELKPKSIVVKHLFKKLRTINITNSQKPLVHLITCIHCKGILMLLDYSSLSNKFNLLYFRHLMKPSLNLTL